MNRRNFITRSLASAIAWVIATKNNALAKASPEKTQLKKPPLAKPKKTDKRLVTSEQQLFAWIKNTPPGLAVPKNKSLIPQWHTKAIEEFKNMLALSKYQTANPKVEQLEQFQYQGLLATRLAITPQTETGGWEALILEPQDTSKKKPAWVCTHGCLSGGMSSVTGLAYNIPGGKESLELCQGDYALQLAKRGYVTISFHCPGFGTRAGSNSKNGRPSEEMMLGTLYLGRPYLGWCIADTMTAVSALSGWPTVDKNKIGAIGFSMGGTTASWTAAVDARVKAAIFSGRVASYRSRILKGRNVGTLACISGRISIMGKGDSVALVAPKPMFVNQEVRNDPEVAAERVNPIIRVYDAMNASDKLTIHYDMRGRHAFSGEPAYKWIEKLWTLK